jgi:hypothetical protein
VEIDSFSEGWYIYLNSTKLQSHFYVLVRYSPKELRLDSLCGSYYMSCIRSYCHVQIGEISVNRKCDNCLAQYGVMKMVE